VSELSGQTALITGASSGIGAEFAVQLAERGADLVLVARSVDGLAAVAEAVRSRFDVRVHTVAMDLSEPGADERLFQRVGDLGVIVAFLVNSAGAGYQGGVAGMDPARMATDVQLNVQAVMGITIRFLPDMLARRRGSIVNVSSTAAFQPTPYLAVYGASKAFVLSFTAALHAETKGTGVRVLALCPGPTDTPMLAGQGRSTLTPMRTPGQVVATALRALDRGKASVVDGRLNAFIARAIAKRFPESLMLGLAARMSRPAPIAEAVRS
jgi:short-subunit dehydrogenase